MTIRRLSDDLLGNEFDLRDPASLPAETTAAHAEQLDAYALWAANYPPEVHNPLMEAEQTAMLDPMPSLAGQVVLDLACAQAPAACFRARAWRAARGRN
ncbi:MAG: hypothetical protein U0521_02160 [Anaerolineae bacterium]